MTERVVLGGAVLCSADAPLQLEQGVWIRDGRVAGIDANALLCSDHPSAELIDARDLILMPGLINTHMHSYGLLSHGMPAHGVQREFFELLDDFWWPYVEDKLDQPMIEAAMALACYHMIRGGITSFCDVLEAPNAPEGILESEADVVRAAGLRAVLMTEASERIDRARGERLLAENASFIRDHQNDEFVSGMLCTHTSFSCSEAFIELARQTMQDLGCDLHLHLSESAYEPKACLERYGERPVMWYDRLGLLSDSVLVSQAVAVDSDEIDILYERGVRVSHQPISNCEVGGGFAPVPAMIKRGIRPGLGTDGYVNSAFEVMRAAHLVQKAVLQELQVMPTHDVFNMATKWGAQALAHPAVGEIKPGNWADLIGISLAVDTPVNPHNAIEQIVIYRDVEHVKLTMVGGNVLMSDGKVLSLDVDKVRRDANQQALRLWESA
jgi:5-methylthioadenosine/S-adenosylhomocysteine deaminase